MIEIIRQWFAGIGAAFRKPREQSVAPARPASEARGEAVVADREPIARPLGSADGAAAAATLVVERQAPPAADRPTAPVAADQTIERGAPVRRRAKARQDARHDAHEDTHDVAHDGAENGVRAEVPRSAPAAATECAPPEQEEIQRRRELVRTLFNDFWSGRDDKPAAFVDRLDEAETYLNERLSASGEIWQLDAGTRKLLGLPPRHSRGEGGGAAYR